MAIFKQRHQELIDEKELIEQLDIIYIDMDDDCAKGIIRQIKGKGINSLSQKQNTYYKYKIEPAIASRFSHCARCFQLVDVEYSFEINGHGDYLCDFCWEDNG